MTEIEKIRHARQCVDRARQRLIVPTLKSMNASACEIADAIDLLKQLEAVLTRGARPDSASRRMLRNEVSGLRRALGQVNELMSATGKFYSGWGRLASSAIDEAPANYTDRGRPAVVVPIHAGVVVHG